MRHAFILIVLCLLLTSCTRPGAFVGLSDQPAAPAVREITEPTTRRAWDGMDPDRIVYVSRNNIAHDSKTCSGMKHYAPMPAADAYAQGAVLCAVCWKDSDIPGLPTP